MERKSLIFLADLAGSECANKDNMNNNSKFKEGASINKSLLSL